jgi:hypothetical protein
MGKKLAVKVSAKKTAKKKTARKAGFAAKLMAKPSLALLLRVNSQKLFTT